MMFRSLTTSLALFFLTVANAQDFTFKDYNWNEKASVAEVPEKYRNEKEVILERHIKTEVLSHNGAAKQFFLFHEKTYISTDDAVERNNKIYIPFGKSESVVLNKARVILPNGKIISLNANDVKEEIDEERGMRYNYFALNGLEKGAIIENLYILEEEPELDGYTIKMQGEFPIVSGTYELIYPDHLVFKTKSYNGLPEAQINENPEKKLGSVKVNASDIPAMDTDEKYANQGIALQMFRYKLDQNLASNVRNMYNYKEFATNFYERFHQPLDKKETKAIEQFCKGINKSSDPVEQIWNIEDKIKKTITYDRYVQSQNTLAEVIKSKQANQRDLLRFYFAVFAQMGIENNLVLTSNRYQLPFDGEFESYENLDQLLFYFPAIKKFITPTEIEYRLPLFPAGLAAQNGLFIKEKSFAGTTMGIGEVAPIDIAGPEVTHDVMEITIDFTKDLANPTVTDKISFGGYSALNFQPYKDFLPEQQYQLMLKEIAKNYTVEAEYKTLKAENEGTEFVGKKPFILETTFDGKDLVRKAGDNYLVSVGQLIGRQMELYQDSKRTLPVEIDYPHSYDRIIKILLPNGVSVKNLEKFNMDFKTEVDGKTQAGFKSEFEQKPSEIVVRNSEYYNIVRYPVESFESYRAVINAAADFNKIVLILSK